MVKKDEDKIEIYEDLLNYKIYRIVGIIAVIVGICLVLGMLIKGNKEYIGTYVVCIIVTFIIIVTIFLVKYCNKKIKASPYIEMVITKEYVEFFSVKEKGKSINKINAKYIKNIFRYGDYIVIHSVDENGEKQKYSYNFGNETYNLCVALDELKKLYHKE